MRWMLLVKSFVIGFISLVLLIPLFMVLGLVETRNVRNQQVRQNVAASAAGRQQLVGPLLVATYKERITWEEKEEKTGKTTPRVEWRHRSKVLVPKELQIKGEAKVEERHRGLYKAQLFHLNAKLSGVFALPADLGLPLKSPDFEPGRVTLVLGLSDLRGIRNRPVLAWGGGTHDFEPGEDCEVVPSGIRVELGPLAASAAHEVSFEIPLELTGSEDLSIAPVAENTQVTLRSDWTSPSFAGRFLPVRHEITDKGFEATWQVFHLARNLDAIIKHEGAAPTEECFSVAFLEPVNVYLQSERAVKYGFLFVGLTFGAFFLFELLKGLRIHPVQYFLVGLALAMFFLLLISLTEHLAFLTAYLVSAGACVVLIGAYLVHALSSKLRGLGFAGGLALLYAALYGLLASEDNALLLGAALLFLALGVVMMATRKLDWYGLSEAETKA
ncbi:MAG: cell envelope integrity protein CreD [Holophagaceae bacterium]|nr:cell envelope integrity protein CreD [Holophagaceae bacterium]